VRRPRAQTSFLVGLAFTSAVLVLAGPAVSAEAPNFDYAKTVSWHLDGTPELSAMETTIHTVLDQVHVTYPGVDGQPIEGFYPGPTYSYEKLPGWTPFYVYVRDSATDLAMVRYYYGATALRTPIEEFLREQYPDGAISATISPDHKVDKATVVSDEETSAIVDAAEAFDAVPDPAWLNQSIRGQTLIERLNHAMQWILDTRRDPDTQLIMRAHTTDWGDIKWEPNSDPSHIKPGDQWTVSIYDQSIAYAALKGLARLNAAAGRDPDRARWEAQAANLRDATNQALWEDDPDHGYYRIHRHVPPNTVEHDFPDRDVIAIGNAAAIYYGLADADKVPRILAALEQARRDAGAAKPGLTLDPAYDGWYQVQMDQRMYQNGAIWDWWGGRQISAEFWSGYSQLARDHLLMLARDWATHPGKVREWESPWLGRTGADQAYTGAAAVVGQSVIEGLYGVSIIGKEVRLTPRLQDMTGGVRVYEPATDIYVAYEYQATERSETVGYGSNSPTALSIHLPVRWRGDTRARLDDKNWLPIGYSRTGQELIGTVIVPSGTHKVSMLRVPSGRAKF
jgi:hypothetical protein